MDGKYPFKDIDPHLDRHDITWLREQTLPPDSGWLKLSGATLSGVDLQGLDLSRVDMGEANLQGANLRGTNMQDAYLSRVNLWGAFLQEAHLQNAFLDRANLQGAALAGANLQGATLTGVDLREVNLHTVHLRDANLAFANMQGTDLGGANLQGAHVRWANLQGANLGGTNLQGANFDGANLQGAYISDANLKGASLATSIFDLHTKLTNSTLGDREQGFVTVADALWNGVNLAVVDWSDLLPERPWLPFSKRGLLGDDRQAAKDKLYHIAARANRQLSLALRAQAINAEAGELDYRAHVWDRKDLWRRRNIFAWIGSWLIWLVSGYGYRLGHSLALYVGTIVLFWLIYHSLSYPLTTTTYALVHNVVTPHVRVVEAYLTWRQAFIMSVTSFHGRGFFPSEITGSIGHGMWAAGEAFIGLLIEATLIATFTQRVFR